MWRWWYLAQHDAGVERHARKALPWWAWWNHRYALGFLPHPHWWDNSICQNISQQYLWCWCHKCHLGRSTEVPPYPQWAPVRGRLCRKHPCRLRRGFVRSERWKSNCLLRFFVRQATGMKRRHCCRFQTVRFGQFETCHPQMGSGLKKGNKLMEWKSEFLNLNSNDNFHF